MSQPFHVAEVFTGRQGRFVQLEDTIKVRIMTSTNILIYTRYMYNTYISDMLFYSLCIEYTLRH